jgi:predicted RNA-binding protein with PIN domain
VTALLRVRGLQVVVDGYNVSKDLRGVPAAGLPEQRAWLQRLVAGAAAGIDARMTIVFDGDRERTSAVAASRIVRTVYTAEDETADERIVAIVDALPGEAPVVVVSSDREVRDACEALGANVVASGVFLQAVS